MRIGIMTFWWSQDNYGQLLQCYALQKYLRDLGHDAFVIRNHLQNSGGVIAKLRKYVFHPWLVLEGVRRVYWRHRGSTENIKFDRHFDDFRKRHIKWSEEEYFSYADLQRNPPKAEMYVVGSDQVWNLKGLEYENNKKAYFLQFGREAIQRISYAPSFGATCCATEEIPVISSWLRLFSHVSCREQDGVSICRQCGVDALWVEDPTLLLCPVHWSGLAIKPKFNMPYVFIYLLSWQSDVSLRNVSEWASEHGLRVVYVKGNRGMKTVFNDAEVVETNPTIEEWLGYVQHASCVITNSFHCSLFSAVFSRHLYVAMLGGSVSTSNNRITDLCARTGNKMQAADDSRLSGLFDCGKMMFPRELGLSGRVFLEAALRNEVLRT